MDVSPPLRVFVAGLSHETNSFSPLPTSIRSFREDVCYRPDDPTGRVKALTFPGYADAIMVARTCGDTPIEGPCFWTQPSGPVSHALYCELRDEVLRGLEQALPVGLVILNLHGAMMAEGVADCEGDLLVAVRQIVGDNIPIGAVLDLHGNVSRQMVESGAVIVGCKEYPHTDYRARTEELYTILADMARNGARPLTTLRSIPILSIQGTTEEPMRGFVRALVAAEKLEGIRSVTLMQGFPWSDWEQTGACLLIVSEDAETEHVDALASDLADAYLRIVANAPVGRATIDAALTQALTASAKPGPIVIADSSDNPGGGAAGDSTFLLRALLDRKVDNATLGMIWDPQAALVAADAGQGARLRMRIGGKVGPLSGQPVDVEVEVLCVRFDPMQRNLNGALADPLGLTVALRADGVDIVVNSIRQQVFSPECFTELGIKVVDKAIVVVKSSQHFRATFDAIARETIYCDAPGSLSLNLQELPYRHIRVKPGKGAFPIDRAVSQFSFPAASPQKEAGE